MTPDEKAIPADPTPFVPPLAKEPQVPGVEPAEQVTPHGTSLEEPPASPASDPNRTIVHLVRHGEVFNPDGVLYGRLPDFHLSERGRKMADRIGEHLGGHDIVRIVSSPLERAQETSAPLAARLGLTPDIDPRIIESSSLFEGSSFGPGSGTLRHPTSWWKVRNPFRPSWGEPYREVAMRMHAAIRAARDEARGHETVLVSHQLPVWTARLAAEGRRLWHDPRRRECSLASVTSFTYEGTRLVAVSYAEPCADLLPTYQPVAGA